MSNPYLAVEKVIESPIKNIILMLSLGLAASDKSQRRGLSSPTNLFSFPFIGAASCASLSEDLCCPIVVQGSLVSRVPIPNIILGPKFTGCLVHHGLPEVLTAD